LPARRRKQSLYHSENFKESSKTVQQLPSGLDAEEPHDVELREDVELALPGKIELPGDGEQPRAAR